MAKVEKLKRETEMAAARLATSLPPRIEFDAAISQGIVIVPKWYKPWPKLITTNELKESETKW